MPDVDTSNPEPSPPLPQPPNPASRWVKYVLAFGVSVAVGLAPFLGLAGVPGFRSLLSLFPTAPFDTHQTLIPLSAFLMGVVAVGVQFYARRRPEWASLGTAFKKLAIVILAALLLLLVLHVLTVHQIMVGAGESVSVLLGFTRPATCQECDTSMSNPECLGHTTLDPGRILSCWSELQIRISFLAMALAYLVLVGTFGALVGILILQEDADGDPPSDEGSG